MHGQDAGPTPAELPGPVVPEVSAAAAPTHMEWSY